MNELNLYQAEGPALTRGFDVDGPVMAVQIFLDLLLKHGNPERALRRMNELGVLAAFIPEFEPIVAMMQFNVYHHYTVDEHIIQCISILAQIERGELVEELPVVSGILKEGLNRKILYVALFLHDIGKGRPEDHSIIGAQLARRICPRLGLTAEETETVEWLVRYHLLMSDMAQKRDIGDPRTVRDFAKVVKSRKRLDLLTVLTVCDIRGVGPGTWNNWKAMLLRQLFAAGPVGDHATAIEPTTGRQQKCTRAHRGHTPTFSGVLAYPIHQQHIFGGRINAPATGDDQRVAGHVRQRLGQHRCV